MARRFYILFIILIPIAFSNLNMSNSIPGFEYFRFFSFLPKDIKYVEVLVVFFSYLASRVWHGKFNILDVLMLLFSVTFLAGNVINGVSILHSIQGLYSYIFPWLILNTLQGGLSIESREFILVQKLYRLIVLICIPIAFVSFFYFRFIPGVNPADVTNLIFRNSNVSSVFMFTISFFELSCYKITREKRALIFTLIAFTLALLGFNEKATVFVFLLFPLYLVLDKQIQMSKLLQYGFISVVLLGGISLYFARSEQKMGLLRVDLLLDMELEKIGPVRSYLRVPSLFRDEGIPVLIGSGYGSYGSSIVQTKINAGNTPFLTNSYNQTLVYNVIGKNGNLIQSALDWTTNIVTSLLIESGIFCFGIFLFSNALVIINWLKGSQLGASSVVSLILLLMIASVNNVNSIEEVCLMVPIFLLGSYKKNS